MKKNPHGRILKGESKEQHLSIVPKSCYYQIIIKKKKKEARQRSETKKRENNPTYNF